MIAKVSGLVGNMKGKVDIGYIKTVIFPEDNFFDIPQPLSTMSFSRFSHKDEAIINTGPAGQGLLLWYPRTTSGPCLFYYATPGTNSVTNITMPVPSTIIPPISSSLTAAIAPSNNYNPTSDAGFTAGFAYDYFTYFSSAVLVGGSL